MASAVKPLIRFSLIAAASAMASGTAALAQNSVPAQPLPGLDSFSLPSNRPPPRVAPSPEPTTNPRPVETETVAPPVVAPTSRAPAAPRAAPTSARTAPAARATPAARSTPTAERTPASRPTESATPTAPPLPVPSATPTVAPTETATPAPIAQPSVAPAAAPATTETGGEYLWLLVGGGLVIAIGLVLWWRRRAGHETSAFEEAAAAEDVSMGAEPVVAVPAMAAAPEPVPTRAPPPASPPIAPGAVDAPRAAIVFELTPKRAGTNLLSASVEYQIVVRNTGDAAATGIRLDIRLLSAGAQQDATIAALFAAPVDRPITAPFDLPAGVAVELSGMALHPKASLEVIEMGGKAMFVPVLTVVAHYDWADGSGRTARSYLIGIDRGAGGKLAPFRIDSGARMVDTVGAIEYPVSATR